MFTLVIKAKNNTEVGIGCIRNVGRDNWMFSIPEQNLAGATSPDLILVNFHIELLHVLIYLCILLSAEP